MYQPNDSPSSSCFATQLKSSLYHPVDSHNNFTHFTCLSVSWIILDSDGEKLLCRSSTDTIHNFDLNSRLQDLGLETSIQIKNISARLSLLLVHIQNFSVKLESKRFSPKLLQWFRCCWGMQGGYWGGFCFIYVNGLQGSNEMSCWDPDEKRKQKHNANMLMYFHQLLSITTTLQHHFWANYGGGQEWTGVDTRDCLRWEEWVRGRSPLSHRVPGLWSPEQWSWECWDWQLEQLSVKPGIQSTQHFSESFIHLSFNVRNKKSTLLFELWIIGAFECVCCGVEVPFEN